MHRRRDAEALEVDDVVRDGTHHAADGVALQEHVDAEASPARERVRRVELELVLELLPLLLGEDREHHLADLRSVEDRQLGHRAQVAVHADDGRRTGREVEVGAAPLDDEVEKVVDVQLVLELVTDDDVRVELARVALARAVDHRDRAHELAAIGDGGDHFEAGRVTDRRERRVARRLGERDDELLALEVDGHRDVLTGELRRQRLGRVLVDRRLEEVDEPDSHLFGERGREVLAPDETQSQQHRRQGLLGSFGFFDRLFEIVS